MNILLDNYQDESSLAQKAIREGFGDGIVEAAEANGNIVVLNADLPGSLKLEKFMEAFPERYFQVGVAEQNMAGIGTGLTHYGKTAFITSFAAFNPGINFSQIRLAVMSHLPIKIVGSHYGLNVGKDGASAQMESDVAMMKALPGMVIINPADYHQAIQATKAIAKTKEPTYLRVTREKFPVFLKSDSEFQIGKTQKLLDGKDLTVIATGSMVYETIQAVLPLIGKGTSVDFLNVHTIKPLDEEAIVASAKKTNKVVVVEEHNVVGGLGESVAALLSQTYPVKMKLIGIQDTFGESGSHKDLWKKYGLNRETISTELTTFIKKS